MVVERGEIWWADLTEACAQFKVNKYSAPGPKIWPLFRVTPSGVKGTASEARRFHGSSRNSELAPHYSGPGADLELCTGFI